MLDLINPKLLDLIKHFNITIESNEFIGTAINCAEHKLSLVRSQIEKFNGNISELTINSMVMHELAHFIDYHFLGSKEKFLSSYNYFHPDRRTNLLLLEYRANEIVEYLSNRLGVEYSKQVLDIGIRTYEDYYVYADICSIKTIFNFEINDNTNFMNKLNTINL